MKKSENDPNLMEKIVSLAKRRGFIFPSSEIYGGFSSSYDYGPLGVELKNNIKKIWWREVVQKYDEIYGLDSAILMHPDIWKASGHLESFTDPLVDCKSCKKRFRADHLLEAESIKPDLEHKKKPAKNIKDSKCPECGGELTEARSFNLMFKTYIGPVEDESGGAYLRPETAQGIFVNFKNILNTSRAKLPFGIAQIGKAFRNEVTPGNFIFRMREFEQMELEYFVDPKEADKWYKFWLDERFKFYIDSLGVAKKNLRIREHRKDELAHYAKACSDIEYNFPFASWSELEGVANRQDYDLKSHQKYSKEELNYTDEKGKKFIPHVIEPSAGVDRSLLTVLVDAFSEVETRSGDKDAKHQKEIVLRFHKEVAPVKIAVLPLSKKENLSKLSKQIFNSLKIKWNSIFDETGSIGKRYRRQDEIGTPYCVTVDFDSLEDKKVTVRDRDTMKQDRIFISELEQYFKDKF